MNNQIPETDQWKLRGDCSKCRRQPFCRKRCTAFKKDIQIGIRNAVSSYTRRKFGNTLADNMEKWL